MRPLTWGPVLEERVRKFFEALLNYAKDEQQNPQIEIRWEDENSFKPRLLAKGKRRFLKEIADFEENRYFTETIKKLKDLKILEDRRIHQRGSDEWYFALRLCSTNINKNLEQFDREWENGRLRRNDQESVKITPITQTFEPVLTMFEIERVEESLCLKTILQPGSLLRIKGPQHMGKTRLLNRVLAKVMEATQNNCRIVTLNWQTEFDSTGFNTYEQFMKNFCGGIIKRLGLPDNLDRYWNQNGSTNSKTTNYFSEHLLLKINSKLILVLEEMDLIFEYLPIAKDFCNLLRGFNQKSSSDMLWQKLSLVLVHSTDCYASLDIEESPLANVGETVTVSEFTLQQINDLVMKYNLPLTNKQVEQLMKLVAGHPFLINHAFKKIANKSITLEEILAKATLQEGIYHDHLLRLWNILKSQPPLRTTFKKVVNESTPVRVNPDILFKLERLGLVKVNGNCASPRCHLYRQYFATHFREES